MLYNDVCQQFSLSIHPNLSTIKPNTLEDIDKIKKQMVSKLSIGWLVKDHRELFDVLNCQDTGEIIAWSCSVFKDGKRTADNFICCDYLALDIDAGMSMTQAIEIVNKHKLGCVIAPSLSHKIKEGDRFRIVFPLASRITDKDKYAYNLNILSQMFLGKNDPSCKDTARLWFGSRYIAYNTLDEYHLFEPQELLVITSDNKTPEKPSKKENNGTGRNVQLHRLGCSLSRKKEPLQKIIDRILYENGLLNLEESEIQHLIIRIIKTYYNDRAEEAIARLKQGKRVEEEEIQKTKRFNPFQKKKIKL